MNYLPNKVRKTWKHTLSPEKNAERIKQMQFCKKVRAALGAEYTVTFYFNPGGPAVWGETYVKIWQNEERSYGHCSIPVVEACLSKEFSYIRQWNGRDSGQNVAIKYGVPDNITGFAGLTRHLASKPFVRF